MFGQDPGGGLVGAGVGASVGGMVGGMVGGVVGGRVPFRRVQVEFTGGLAFWPLPGVRPMRPEPSVSG
jgi:hypothetical protein